MGYIAVFLLGFAGGVGGYITVIPTTFVQAQTLSPEERARLQAEYDALQKEIAQWQKVLDETRAKKNTIQGDVTALDAQIKKAQAEIKQRNGTISRLITEISQKSSHIASLEARIEDGRDSLAKLLRQKNEVENTSFAVLVLSSQDLSEFFSSVDSIDSINRSLQDRFAELRGVKTETEKEKEALDEKRSAELNARYEVQRKEAQIAEDKKEKDELLSITKKEESSYQGVLAERQRRAEQIRSALFELRDTQGITFELALQYAQLAESSTGVRAAFILGILRQESNLGQNVGQCYLTDPATGAGKGKNTGTPFKNVMHATRDVPVFLDIMTRLGADPFTQVVSCPQSVGYGGAMGPSQFIPSTWKSYESRIAAATGARTPDPWNAKHAITATALYLKDLGAAKQTYSAEREAAARYYAGGNWQKYGLSYAASVLSFAEKYQDDIDFLKDN